MNTGGVKLTPPSRIRDRSFFQIPFSFLLSWKHVELVGGHGKWRERPLLMLLNSFSWALKHKSEQVEDKNELFQLRRILRIFHISLFFSNSYEDISIVYLDHYQKWVDPWDFHVVTTISQGITILLFHIREIGHKNQSGPAVFFSGVHHGFIQLRVKWRYLFKQDNFTRQLSWFWRTKFDFKWS